MATGFVKWFDMSKGFGFIEGADGQNVFVHFDDVLTIGYEPLLEGQEVSFTVKKELKGLRAFDVQIINSKPRKLTRSQKRAKKAKKPRSHNSAVPPGNSRSKALGHSRIRLVS